MMGGTRLAKVITRHPKLPALTVLAHQKVPSSVAKCTQPTIRSGGRLHYMLPASPSAHVQPADRGAQRFSSHLVPKYYAASVP